MANSNQYQSVIDEYINIINNRLDDYLQIQQEDKNYSQVIDAMRYSVLNGGKRLRALLVLIFCGIGSGNIQNAISLACAVEMVHAYSLIHDDLPCMDDDDLRRGKPSCHVKYGESTALLAGDALLTMAFEIISESKGLSDNQKVRCIKELSTLAGYKGMIGGQVVDLLTENIDNSCIDEKILIQISELKTSALITSACTMGAIAGGFSEEEISDIRVFAKNFGLSFQIIDDILDVIGDQEKIGKPVGSDEKNNKKNFVSILGVENAMSMAEKLTKDGIVSLNKINRDIDLIIYLVEKFMQRQK